MYKLEKEDRIDIISSILSNLISGVEIDEETVFALCDVYKAISDNGEDKIKINLGGFKNSSARFNPGDSTVYTSIPKIGSWALNNSSNVRDKYKIGDKNVIRAYLELMVLFHELEHGKQFLIANGDICNETGACLSNAYKSLFDIFIKKDTILPRPIKNNYRLSCLSRYARGEDFYVLERNANVEAYRFLSELALYREEKELYVIFVNLLLETLKIGYINGTWGSVYETYREVFLRSYFSRLKLPDGLDLSDRLRYGFPIDNQERAKVLSYRNISK